MILAKAAYLQKKLSQLDSADILISLGIGVTVSTGGSNPLGVGAPPTSLTNDDFKKSNQI